MDQIQLPMGRVKIFKVPIVEKRKKLSGNRQ
jgi:hypothetical protein